MDRDHLFFAEKTEVPSNYIDSSLKKLLASWDQRRSRQTVRVERGARILEYGRMRKMSKLMSIKQDSHTKD